jgi:hypothetical protein
MRERISKLRMRGGHPSSSMRKAAQNAHASYASIAKDWHFHFCIT